MKLLKQKQIGIKQNLNIKNCIIVLTGTMTKEEMENILKNLYFMIRKCVSFLKLMCLLYREP